MNWGHLESVSVAVRSLDAAAMTYTELLGFEPLGPVVEGKLGYGLRYLALGVDGVQVLELIESTNPIGPIGKFLAQRGEGLYQVRVTVTDLEAHCQALEASGAKVVRSRPVDGSKPHLAWVHPSSSHGILIEMKEKR